MIRYEYKVITGLLSYAGHNANKICEEGWELWKTETKATVPHWTVVLWFRRPLGWYQPDIDRARAWAERWKGAAKRWRIHAKARQWMIENQNQKIEEILKRVSEDSPDQK